MDRRRFLSLAATLCVALPAVSALPRFALAKTQTVSYGSGKLDIYATGTSGAPVIVYVHGGAWKAGSRGQVGSMPDYFTGRGYVFVSVGYSLSADVGRQAQEVAQAINWVRANAAGFGGDGGRVAVMGHSAGCHLASLAVLSGLAQGVRALVANDTAAYDVAYLADINNGRLPLLYASPFKDRSKWKDWSPISYSGRVASVPVMVAWSGGRDRDRISQRFAAALENGGHRVVRYDGGRYNHISISKAVGRQGDPLNTAVSRFLDAILAPANEAASAAN